MRVLLSAFGTAGDHLPFFALADALRARGDEPVLLLNPAYEEDARRRGFAFVPVGARWTPEDVADNRKYVDPRTGGMAIWNDFYLPNVTHTFEAVDRAIRDWRADRVVAHWLCFGAHFAARRASIPHAVVSLAPCWWYSRRDPSNFTALEGGERYRRFLQFLPRWLVNRVLSRSLRAPAEHAGLAPRRDEYFCAFTDAAANLALWSPRFRGVAADDPPHATLCGFSFDDGAPEAPLDAIAERFLDAGDAPVVVGLGSSTRAAGDALHRAIARVVVARGDRALLIGASQDVGAGLDGVLAIPHAPYRHVFARARAIVHHGGVGTMAEAMRSGKPTAIVPFVNDQFDNARRAHALGVAHRWHRSTWHGKRLETALTALCEDSVLADCAAAFASQLRADGNGATHAADALAQMDTVPTP